MWAPRNLCVCGAMYTYIPKPEEHTFFMLLVVMCGVLFNPVSLTERLRQANLWACTTSVCLRYGCVWVCLSMLIRAQCRQIHTHISKYNNLWIISKRVCKKVFGFHPLRFLLFFFFFLFPENDQNLRQTNILMCFVFRPENECALLFVGPLICALYCGWSKITMHVFHHVCVPIHRA